jgi:hypothetical protein
LTSIRLRSCFEKGWITGSKSRQRRESKKTAAGESQNPIS